MGIHQNWKAILKENYNHCFLSQIDDLDEQLDVLIIDFLPMIFGKSKNIKTGEHFLNYVFKVRRATVSHCARNHWRSVYNLFLALDHTRLLRQRRAHLRHRHRHPQVCSSCQRYGVHQFGCCLGHRGLTFVSYVAPTQMDRDKYSKPLTKEELGLDQGKDVMSRGLLIHQEWHRVMANRDLREEIFRYFEQEFLKNFFSTCAIPPPLPVKVNEG
jgi:hypothetical protein